MNKGPPFDFTLDSENSVKPLTPPPPLPTPPSISNMFYGYVELGLRKTQKLSPKRLSEIAGKGELREMEEGVPGRGKRMN